MSGADANSFDASCQDPDHEHKILKSKIAAFNSATKASIDNLVKNRLAIENPKQIRNMIANAQSPKNQGGKLSFLNLFDLSDGG